MSISWVFYVYKSGIFTTNDVALQGLHSSYSAV